MNERDADATGPDFRAFRRRYRRTRALWPAVAAPTEKQSLTKAARWQRDVFEGIPAALRALAPGQRLIVPVLSRALLGKEQASMALAPRRAVSEIDKKRLIAEVVDFPAQPSLSVVEATATHLSFFCCGGLIARVDRQVGEAGMFASCAFLGLSADLDGTDDPVGVMRHIWSRAVSRDLSRFYWNLSGDDAEAATWFEPFAVTFAS